MENPLNPVKASVKKDPHYDSAADVKAEVKKVMCASKIFVRKIKPKKLT